MYVGRERANVWRGGLFGGGAVWRVMKYLYTVYELGVIILYASIEKCGSEGGGRDRGREGGREGEKERREGEKEKREGEKEKREGEKERREGEKEKREGEKELRKRKKEELTKAGVSHGNDDAGIFYLGEVW